MPRTLVFAALILSSSCGFSSQAALAARPDGKLQLQVVDEATGEPIPARVHLKNNRRRAVKTRGLGIAQHADHFYLDGEATLELRRGAYTFDLDAGWEYRTRKGDFEIVRHADDSQQIQMHRFADMAAEGWLAGDLDCSRSPVGIDLAMRAEQLAYAPSIAIVHDGNRWREDKKTFGDSQIKDTAALFESKWGDLLFCKPDAEPQLESFVGKQLTLDAIDAAREEGYYAVAMDLTAWRLPIWLAADALDAAMVIDRSNQWSGTSKSASKGRPASRTLFPGPTGPGRWREAIYFHTLGAGLRLPPAAGSGTGPTDNPLGANRAYVYQPKAGGKLNASQWWESLVRGESVISSGPLLRPNVFGQRPGFTFPLDESGKFEAKIGLNLSTRQTVDYLELIQNGEPVLSVRLADWAADGGRLPPLEFDGPGWFAVRAVTTAEDRYQYALTAPYFVGGGAESGPRISARSCLFFLDWLDAYEQKLGNKAAVWQREELAEAREFWTKQRANATVD